MPFLEWIARIGLLFCNPSILASIITIGFLTQNERVFARTLFLLTFTLISNFYLKSLWQVPLIAHMDGWAFPSGHMSIAVVFWGYLACIYRNFIFSALVGFMLCLAGYGLVYQGYHYPIDILGSVIFGAISITIYLLL